MFGLLLGLGPRELIVVSGLLVLFFGANKMAELARGVGEAVKILRESFSSKTDKTDKKN